MGKVREMESLDRVVYVMMLKRQLRKMSTKDLRELLRLLTQGEYETEQGAKIVRQVLIEKRRKELQTA